jgi:hypothetical protein
MYGSSHGSHIYWYSTHNYFMYISAHRILRSLLPQIQRWWSNWLAHIGSSTMPENWNHGLLCHDPARQIITEDMSVWHSKITTRQTLRGSHHSNRTFQVTSCTFGKGGEQNHNTRCSAVHLSRCDTLIRHAEMHSWTSRWVRLLPDHRGRWCTHSDPHPQGMRSDARTTSSA